MREPFSTFGRRSLRNCLRPLLLSPALFFRSSFSLWLHQLKTRTAPPTSRATQVVRFIWKSSFRLLRNHICTLNLLLYFCPVFFCRRWFEGGGETCFLFYSDSLKWRTLDRLECAPSFSCMHPSSTLQTLTTNSEL